MVEQISDTIKNKLKKIYNDPSGKTPEFKMIIELLETTSRIGKKTQSTAIKREFQLLLDQYFQYREDKNE